MKKKATLLTFMILLLLLAVSTFAQTPQYYNSNTGSSANTYPFGQPVGQRVHWLIRIGTMILPTPCPGGNIDTIYFRMNNTGTAIFTNMTIKMKSLGITTLPTAWYTTQLDTAYFRASVTLSCTPGGWMAIPLDHPILYDTSKGLVIDVQQCGYSGTGLYVYQSSGTTGSRDYGTPSACPVNYAGQDGQIINFGVHVSPPPPPPPPYCICDSAGYTSITGTPGPSGDDATITVPIGFTFTYAGHSYTQASICTNGFVVLGSSTYNSFNNLLCGTAAGQNPMLTPFWDDLNTINGGNIIYNTLGPSPNRIFVVQYTNVAYFSGSGGVTMQVRLYETSNRIEFIYGPATANPSSSGSVGETDSIGGSGHVYSLTPGSTCPGTTFSQTVCNNAVAWTAATFPVGRRYTFNCPTGIEPLGQGIPREYKLSQNYPNPFNPTTKISFALPKAGNVELSVYDLLGREVSTLVNEFKTPGSYTINFNASSLASGVYFYTIKSGDFTDTKKMVLIK
jgi:hypothetical protein